MGEGALVAPAPCFAAPPAPSRSLRRPVPRAVALAPAPARAPRRPPLAVSESPLRYWGMRLLSLAPRASPCRGAHTEAHLRCATTRQVPANVKEQTTTKHASVEVEVASLSAALATFKELKAAGN
jgi:hypothetical protein